jgi:CRP/FNR family transcriptional regulator, cyclic AMP receptor protein
VARILSRRVRLVTGYLVDLKRQFADRDDHLAMVDAVLESLVHRQGAESELGSDRAARVRFADVLRTAG